jgi:hypothetical protein
LIKLFPTIKSWVTRAQHAFDMRDVFVFGGLALLGYGLFLLRPWLGYSVAGLLLMIIGYLMEDKS